MDTGKSSGRFHYTEQVLQRRRYGPVMVTSGVLVQLPVENGEDLQILRYEHGQKYDEHWDWFDAEELEKMNMTDGNRIATVLMYLSGADRAFYHRVYGLLQVHVLCGENGSLRIE